MNPYIFLLGLLLLIFLGITMYFFNQETETQTDLPPVKLKPIIIPGRIN